jgi:4-amino-4-deoxy-L-arabinose transferase-like glycosyltransferase
MRKIGITLNDNFKDFGILISLALSVFLLHMLVNSQYGFHRDELATLDDARYLAWGYVAYPPVTPFTARLALELFGVSLVGVRLFAALAQSISIVLTGLMARELGGSRVAQFAAAVAMAITPMSLVGGAMFHYVSFDYLWWVLVAYLTIRLLKSKDPRWWLGIGAAIGLGMTTKYTMAFFVAGVVGGIVLTQARRYLISPWLWGGVALSLLIFLPNLIWQIQHDFISLDFLSSIHARDVRIGRTAGYLGEQFIFCTNPFTVPLWVAGLIYYFFVPADKRFRPLGWMYVITFGLFFATQGRSYYLAPAYPMLIAAGVVAWESWLIRLPVKMARIMQGLGWSALAAGAAFGAALALPLAPVNSSLWDSVREVHDLFTEQIGWQELVETVADIYAALPAEEKPQVGILAGNYGEAGAINLYGPAYGLPEAISGMNTHWLRGYGNPPPQTLIVLGFPRSYATRLFKTCDYAGQITNRYGVENEETRDHPVIYVCREPLRPWPVLWDNLQSFG